MTVAELISVLETYPGATEVYVSRDSYGNSLRAIDDVDIVGYGDEADLATGDISDDVEASRYQCVVLLPL